MENEKCRGDDEKGREGRMSTIVLLWEERKGKVEREERRGNYQLVKVMSILEMRRRSRVSHS